MAAKLKSSNDEYFFGDINIADTWRTYKFSKKMKISSVVTALSKKGVDFDGMALVNEENIPVSKKRIISLLLHPS